MKRIFALTLSLSSSACLLSPNQGEPLCGANANVVFSGYTTYPNQLISLQAATARDGAFTTITTVRSSPTAFFYGGMNLYSFSKTAQIPIWKADGQQLKTYVRAQANFGSPGLASFYTFDEHPSTGGNAMGCIQSRIAAGMSLAQATSSCSSADSPIAEIVVPGISTCPCSNTNVAGNVVINNAIDAANYVCTQQIGGSLTVLESAPGFVAFPSLSSIGGNAVLHFEVPIPLPSGFTAYEKRTIQTPALTSIGNDVSLFARTDGSPQVDMGLDAVTFVGGDIDFTVYQASPNAFGSLTQLPGNLSIHPYDPTQHLDLDGFAMLPSLGSIGGNVDVQHFTSMYNLLTSLQTIGGNLHFADISNFFDYFSSLDSVGGELFISNMSYGSIPPTDPLSTLSVHALRVENMPQLNAITGVQVGSGDIHIHQNPMLSQCTVNSFLAAQQAGGWTGTAFVTDTIACP